MPDDVINIPGLDEMETPAYVYDLDEVHRAYGRLRDALPPTAEVYYSLKANPHPAIVAALVTAGCRVEVCSPGELDIAIDLGVALPDILYTGPGKRDRDVAEAIKDGVTWFSVDSPHGLRQINAAAAAHGTYAQCLLRINDDAPAPGQGLTMTGVASQFGADADWVAAEPERFAALDNARICGFHLYMGSNLADENSLMMQFTQAARTARRLAEICDITVDVLDLGGGFGAPYARAGAAATYPTLARNLEQMLDETFPHWRTGQPRVAFESGRYLTASCGTLLTRVLDVKQSHGRQIVVLESGINHLGGMSGLRRLPMIKPTLTTGGSDEVMSDVIVAGPLCTPLDTWARGCEMAAVGPGDLVSVPNVGAYGLYASLLAFLGHPAPLEVIVADGQIAETSRLTLRRQAPINAEVE